MDITRPQPLPVYSQFQKKVMKNTNDHFAKFESLIEDIKIGILVTRSADGKDKGRPMSTAQIDDDGNLWFFTNEFALMVKEISVNNEIFLSYASPSKNSYVVINGMAELVHDKAKMSALWQPAYKVWFPEGLDDPNILLLKITPREVEYWDGPNKIVMAAQMLKAYVSGEEFKGGEHEKLAL